MAINNISGTQKYASLENTRNINNSATCKTSTYKMQEDSFIKTSKPALIPDVYTKEDVTGTANTTAVSENESLELTQEQILYYFGIRSGEGYQEYISLINAPDDVKRAWIKTMDEIYDNRKQKDDYIDLLRAKEAAAGSGFLNGSNEGIVKIYDDGRTEILGGSQSEAGESNPFSYYRNLFMQGIEYYDTMKNPYTEAELANNWANGGSVVAWGAKEEADFFKTVLEMFEKNYDKYE